MSAFGRRNGIGGMSPGARPQFGVSSASRRLVEPGVFAYQLVVRNSDRGLGIEVQDTSRDFGSAGRYVKDSAVDRILVASGVNDPELILLLGWRVGGHALQPHVALLAAGAPDCVARDASEARVL